MWLFWCIYFSYTKYCTGTIATAGVNPVKRNQTLAAASLVAFTNSAPSKDCRTEISDTFVDYADFINTTMSMYNLIEYTDNYSDTSGSLWSFKRDEIVNYANVSNDDGAHSCKYKAGLIVSGHWSKWNKNWSENSCTTKISE